MLDHGLIMIQISGLSYQNGRLKILNDFYFDLGRYISCFTIISNEDRIQCFLDIEVKK